MKLIGYCTECHKIKRVNASPSFLASGRSPVRGVCDDCRNKERGR